MNKVLHAEVETPQSEAGERHTCDEGEPRGERVCGEVGEKPDGETGGEELEVDEPEAGADGAYAAHEKGSGTCGGELENHGDKAHGGDVDGGEAEGQEIGC